MPVQPQRIPVVYLTRFNLRFARREPVHLNRDWLNRRLDLFRRFTIPKMASQTDMDFRWLIMADEATDEDVLAELAAAPNAAVLRVNGENGNDAARSVIGRNVGRLITVRLDSDDQVSCKFTALVRSEAAHVIAATHKECAIYFVNGMQFDTASGKYFRKYQYTNMFPALYESRWPVPRTANFRAHTALPQMVRCVLVCNDEPMWCNIVHGGNVLNVIDGTPMDGGPAADW